MMRFLLGFTLAATSLFAQSELVGSIHDSQGKPVADATVELRTTGKIFTARTDAQGAYRFQVRDAGSYTIHAMESKSGEAEFGPFALGQQETKKIDLTMKPQFFDEPTFIVAGVTDPTQRGGHGSDPVLRSVETLARETASLGTVAERDGNPLETVRKYQRAAELDPSEANLFDWAAELLTHRAAEQAVEVFGAGNRKFPGSSRMLLGLAVALYSRGSYDQAVQRFFEAADLNPSDPVPYLFLGKISNGAITESSGYGERLERFVRLHPENAWANYYYGANLWMQRKDTAQAQALLEKAVRLDPHLGEGFLQLGAMFAEQGNLAKAISAYRSAIEATPSEPEAHYRLAQAYRKSGEPEKAKTELEIYRQLSKQSAEQLERERAEIQQFVFSMKRR
jgi:tetratricopeptide (TPR) repeat protein